MSSVGSLALYGLITLVDFSTSSLIIIQPCPNLEKT